MFAAIVYVLVSCCAWRALPPCFGISKSTAHRRFLIWSRAAVWGRLHEEILHRLDDAGLLDLSRAVLDSAHVRAKNGASSQVRAPWTGVSRVPRCTSCRDAAGLPLLVGLTAANTHASQALKPMVLGHQTRHDPHRGRHSKPQRLHADKAYDTPELGKWLRGKRIGVRIARKGIESSERLGRRRRVIERTMSWLTGYRRLNHRYERHPATTWYFSLSPQPSAATSDSSASRHRTRSKPPLKATGAATGQTSPGRSRRRSRRPAPAYAPCRPRTPTSDTRRKVVTSSLVSGSGRLGRKNAVTSRNGQVPGNKGPALSRVESSAGRRRRRPLSGINLGKRRAPQSYSRVTCFLLSEVGVLTATWAGRALTCRADRARVTLIVEGRC
ncbi:IS5 family transposase [Streptomyces sp. NPDC001552]|uniref:IS5 family transposase n=1 Tax=Streptomyces sp. NPDC001552 TaxID=3364587 RepID=UPI0036A6D352